MKRLMNDDLGKALKTLLDVRVLLVFCATLVGLGWGGNRWVDSKLVWAGELRQYIQSVEKDQHVQNLQIQNNADDSLTTSLQKQWKDLDDRAWRYESRYLNNPSLMPEGMRADIRTWRQEMADLDVKIKGLLVGLEKNRKEVRTLTEPGVTSSKIE